METSTDISDLASVSFDFETKSNHTSSDRVENNEVPLPVPNETSATGCCYSSFRQAKQDISLDLSLGQKTENLFATDQTPTPTRLIKNCDEVGLFEDLQHVNPFDIGFQRAAEQNTVGAHAASATPTNTDTAPNEGDSLHTPHVFPLDSIASVTNNSTLNETEAQVDEILAEKISEAQPLSNSLSLPSVVSVPHAVALQFLQPQLITVVLPAPTISVDASTASRQLISGIPVQTVRPFILPKSSTSSIMTVTSTNALNKSQNTIVPNTPAAYEPSSASLTPTSQLPIKERLKAILNSQNKQRGLTTFNTKYTAKQAACIRSEDCMERRRAAASRYRDKRRNEHKELKLLNAQLQQDNRQLRKRISALEGKLRAQMQLHNDNGNNLKVAPDQLQVPPSSIHLVINMPKMMVPSDVQQTSIT